MNLQVWLLGHLRCPLLYLSTCSFCLLSSLPPLFLSFPRSATGQSLAGDGFPACLATHHLPSLSLLFLFISICLSIYISIYLSISLSLYLCIYLYNLLSLVLPSSFLSFLSFHPSLPPSLYLSILCFSPDLPSWKMQRWGMLLRFSFLIVIFVVIASLSLSACRTIYILYIYIFIYIYIYIYV